MNELGRIIGIALALGAVALIVIAMVKLGMWIISL